MEKWPVENNLESFATVCRQIHRDTPPKYSWSWDSRFGVALLVFDKEDSEAVFASVIKEFMAKWDSRTIAKSSELVRKVVKATFDIKPGQLIFTSDEDLGALLLAAWWPWANGSVISLRVGIFPAGKRTLQQEDVRRHLVEWFGITPDAA